VNHEALAHDLESQLIDYRGGAWSDTGEPHKTENKFGGVDKAHAWSWRFYDVATARFSEALAPYDMKY
jgi:hypothetical protein